MTEDLPFAPATTLAAAIQAKEVSSRELLAAYLARAEALNPKVNAIVTFDVEGAQDRAAAADEALARGEVWGPLHGLPMTVKDSFETAGVRTTSGDPEHADHVPTTDADAVARLKDAGAVIFGKTNMPMQGADWQSFNDLFGATSTPWDAARTSGGSSGGSAAALAAGITAFELGSDIAGSLRVPAHNCGVYGLKTSQGVISPRGHVPGAPGSLSKLDLVVMGPMGRSADDLDLGLDVLAGPDAVDGTAWSIRFPAPRANRLEDYRIGVWLDDPYCPIDAEVGDVLSAAVDALAAAGAKVTETAAPLSLAEAHHDLYQPFLMAVASGIFPDEVFEEMIGLAQLDPEGEQAELARLGRMMTVRVRDWNHLHERRLGVARQWAELFQDIDVLLCPVSPVVALPHDHRPMEQRTMLVNGEHRSYEEQQVWTGMVNMAYLPSAAAPVGLSRSGIPVGIQVVAPFLEDRTAVDVARRMADVVGGFTPPPGF